MRMRYTGPDRTEVQDVPEWVGGGRLVRVLRYGDVLDAAPVEREDGTAEVYVFGIHYELCDEDQGIWRPELGAGGPGDIRISWPYETIGDMRREWETA